MCPLVSPGVPRCPPRRLEQLGFNALLQLMIGVPLEMVHGILRISFLYLAGVLAGGRAPAPVPNVPVVPNVPAVPAAGRGGAGGRRGAPP